MVQQTAHLILKAVQREQTAHLQKAAQREQTAHLQKAVQRTQTVQRKAPQIPTAARKVQRNNKLWDRCRKIPVRLLNSIHGGD